MIWVVRESCKYQKVQDVELEAKICVKSYRKKARKKERNHRKKSDLKRYDITLEAAQKDKPLELYVAKKETPKDKDGEAKKTESKDELDDAEDAEIELEPLTDPHLRETLSILGDYEGALLKNPPTDLDSSVAAKK